MRATWLLFWSLGRGGFSFWFCWLMCSVGLSGSADVCIKCNSLVPDAPDMSNIQLGAGAHRDSGAHTLRFQDCLEFKSRR